MDHWSTERVKGLPGVIGSRKQILELNEYTREYMMLIYQEAHSLRLDNRTIVRTPRDTAQVRKGIKWSSEGGLLEYYISLGYKTNTNITM